jgi:hypothetical protein
MVSLNSVEMLALVQENCKTFRDVLEWQGTHGIEVSLTSSPIARLHVPGPMHIDLRNMVSVASASEAALELGTGCEEFAELTGDEPARVNFFIETQFERLQFSPDDGYGHRTTT